MTAAAPSPSEDRRPPGEGLVERGITPEPVEAATPAAASELADRDRMIAELRAWAESAQAAIASRDDAIAHLRAALAQQTTPQPAAETGAHEEALEALRAELAATLEEHAAAIASRDETLAQLRAQLADNSAHEEALAALRAELAATLEKHAAETARLEAAGADLDAARAREAELERRVENARSRAETLARRITEQHEELEALRAAAAAPAAAEPSRWASAPMHYVLRRSANGYDLLAHDGPPPAVGETVDGLRVARVAPAGPGFDVPCAYLAD